MALSCTYLTLTTRSCLVYISIFHEFPVHITEKKCVHHLYYLLKTKANSLFSELFSYIILKNWLNQTNFFYYSSYFGIFALSWDTSNLIKIPYKTNLFQSCRLDDHITKLMSGAVPTQIYL